MQIRAINQSSPSWGTVRGAKSALLPARPVLQFSATGQAGASPTPGWRELGNEAIGLLRRWLVLESDLQIEAGASQLGDSQSRRTLDIRGHVSGNAKTGKRLTVYESGTVTGDAEAGHQLSISGSVYKNARANLLHLFKYLPLLPTGRSAVHGGYIGGDALIAGPQGVFIFEPDTSVQGKIRFEQPGGTVALNLNRQCLDEIYERLRDEGNITSMVRTRALARQIAIRELKFLLPQIEGQNLHYAFYSEAHVAFGQPTWLTRQEIEAAKSQHQPIRI